MKSFAQRSQSTVFNSINEDCGDFSWFHMFVVVVISLYAYARFRILSDCKSERVKERPCEYTHGSYILVLVVWLSIVRLRQVCYLFFYFCGGPNSQYVSGSTHSVEILSSIGLKVVYFSLLLLSTTAEHRFVQKEILQNI